MPIDFLVILSISRNNRDNFRSHLQNMAQIYDDLSKLPNFCAKK